MPTRFRKDSTARQAPSWCAAAFTPPPGFDLNTLAKPPPDWIEGLPPPLWTIFGTLPPIVAAAIAALPARLSIFTFWLDLNTAPPIDITAAFPLRYRRDTADYYGASAPTGLRLIACIQFLPTPGRYDLHLEAWRDNTFLDDDSWHNIDAGPPPRFDTREQSHVYQSNIDANGAHATT